MDTFGDIREVHIGDAVLRPQLNRLRSNGTEVRLQPKVVETLVYLARRQGEVVSRSELLDHVWEGTYVKEEAVTTVVSQARRAFGGSAKDSPIETVPKRGYRLVVPVEFVAGQTAQAEPTFLQAGGGEGADQAVRSWFRPMHSGWRLVFSVLTLVLLLLAFRAYLPPLFQEPQFDSLDERHTVFSGHSQPSQPAEADQLFDQGLHFLQQETFLGNENAVALFIDALRQNPDHAQAHLGLAQALQSRVERYGYRRTLLETAANHAREAAQLDPRSGHIQRTLGDLERLKGHSDAALKAYLAAAQLQPEDGLTAKHIGLLYRGSNDLDQALTWLRKAHALTPRDAEVASEIGSIHVSLDQLEEAEHWLQRAIDLEPMGATYRARLSTVYVLQEKWRQAEAPCLALLAHFPDNVECLVSLGEAAVLQERSEDAEGYFQRALACQPEHNYVRLRQAHLMLLGGRQEEARRLLDQVQADLMRRRGDHWTHFWMMAAISSIKRQPQEAVHWLDRTFEAGRLLFRWDASDPAFRPLRGSDGYQRYLEKMKEKAARLRQSSQETRLTRSFS